MTNTVAVKVLHAKIGELTLANDFLEGALGRTAGERKTMIDKSQGLPLTGQAKALGISWGGVCYLARPTPDPDLALMRRVDALHPEHPFAGSRMPRDMRRRKGARSAAAMFRRS